MRDPFKDEEMEMETEKNEIAFPNSHSQGAGAELTELRLLAS